MTPAERPGWLGAVSDRVLVVGLAALLIVLPWHEYIVLLWQPLHVWKELVLSGLFLAALATRSKPIATSPLLWPFVALAVVCLSSCWANGQSLLSPLSLLVPVLAGIVASVVRRDELNRILRWFVPAAVVVVAYALVAHLAFRLTGGGYRLRPVHDSLLLRGLVFPYYTGTYPRGDRLVGPFLNDDYFGIWCVAVLSLIVVSIRRAPAGRWMVAGLAVMAALVWTYSRSALCSLVAAIMLLALRLDRRVLVVIPLGLALSLVFVDAAQVQRFRHPLASETGRIAAVQRGLDTLASFSVLGAGPGYGWVYDMQFARLTCQLGWAGLAVLAWGTVTLFTLIGQSPRSPSNAMVQAGLSAATLGIIVGGVGTEVLEVPQTAWTFWILFGLLAAVSKNDGPPAAPAASLPIATG